MFYWRGSICFLVNGYIIQPRGAVELGTFFDFAVQLNVASLQPTTVTGKRQTDVNIQNTLL